eukprot:2166353-Alexandrium_andersonii.AAC.1
MPPSLDAVDSAELPPRVDDVPLCSPPMEALPDGDAGDVDIVDGADFPEPRGAPLPEPVRQFGG